MEQYDGIQETYIKVLETTNMLFEKEFAHSMMQKEIPGARILDLACGAGVHSYDFLKLGASSVVGVDISADAITVARDKGKGMGAEVAANIKFLVADCTRPVVFEGGNYDVVFAAWLLDNVAEAEQLTNMLRTVRMNLRRGGKFFAVTWPPSNQPKSYVEAVRMARPREITTSGFFFDSYQEIADGVAINLEIYAPGVPVAHAATYILRQDVYEQAVADAGFTGSVKWVKPEIPIRYLTGGEELNGTTLEEMQTYQRLPFRYLMIIENN